MKVKAARLFSFISAVVGVTLVSSTSPTHDQSVLKDIRIEVVSGSDGGFSACSQEHTEGVYITADDKMFLL